MLQVLSVDLSNRGDVFIKDMCDGTDRLPRLPRCGRWGARGLPEIEEPQLQAPFEV